MDLWRERWEALRSDFYKKMLFLTLKVFRRETRSSR